MANKTHSDEKRLQLALALCRLLQAQEYSSISVHDIAREAGMNHGLIHYYFGSKDALLIEAIKISSDWQIALLEDLKQYNSASEMWKKMKQCLLQFPFDGSPVENNVSFVVWLSFDAAALSRPNVKELLHQHYTIKNQLIVQLLTPHVKPGIDPQYLANTISQFVLGTIPVFATESVSLSTLQASFDLFFDALSVYLNID